MSHRVVTINPGASSTKVALFDDDQCVARVGLDHYFSDEVRLFDQLPRRRELVQDFLDAHLGDGHLDAVVGRGGLLPPLAAGTYLVTPELLDLSRRAERGEHASNLGALLAAEIAEPRGVPAFIVDPVSVDELSDVARIAGLEGVERVSLCHALNIRAVAHRHALQQARPLDELRLVVAHLGTGISMAALDDGKMVDVVNPRDEGPIGMDRPGALPNFALLDRCFDAGLNRRQLQGQILGDGGVFSYLGTRDLREVQARRDAGDSRAALILDALVYDTAKWIAAMATVLCGRLDAILLTGGMAHSQDLIASLSERIGWIAPIFVYPGEDELQAMAQGALRVLRGQTSPRRLMAP